ncbi:winged helix-turn-helix transcriptional regulator [Archaeoglobus sp.]
MRGIYGKIVLVGSTIVAMAFILSYLSVGATNPPVVYTDISNITRIAYQTDVYVDYINKTPYFYVNFPKRFKYEPVTVCAKVYGNLVKGLGFRLSCSKFDVLITNEDVCNCSEIVFGYGIKHERITKVIWLKNPLNIPPTYVKARYDIAKKGEVLAVYSDGGNAVVRVGKKIYVGFEPTNATLANLLAFYSIKDVNRQRSLIVVTAVTVASIISVFVAIYRFLDKIIYKIAGFLALLVIPIGYVRYDKDYILLNDTRRMIYEYILDNPGTHFRDIVRELNISISTATWHIRILEKAGLIKKKKVGNKIIFYPTGMEKNDLIIVATLNNEKATKIVEYLLNVGKAHARKIAKDLDMNVETVRYNLKKLEGMGIVRSKAERNKIVYFINPDVVSSLSNLY